MLNTQPFNPTKNWLRYKQMEYSKYLLGQVTLFLYQIHSYKIAITVNLYLYKSQIPLTN